MRDSPAGRPGVRWNCCWSCCQTPSSDTRARARAGLGEGVGQCTSAQDAPRALHTPTPPTTTPCRGQKLAGAPPHPQRKPGRGPVRGPCPHLPNPTAPSQLSWSLRGPWGLQAGTVLGSWYPPTSWGGARRSPWGEGRHGHPRTLRGLTLLHSSTGIKKGVMEKLICRKDGPEIRRVQHQGSQGEG